MARITVTNNLTGSYLVPAPIRAFLRGGETKTFSGVSLFQVGRSAPFVSAINNGTITATAIEDPGIPDVFEPAPRSGGSVIFSGTSLTLGQEHSGITIRCTANTLVSVTFPAGLGEDFVSRLIQEGTGSIQVIAGAGITLNHPSSFQARTSEQWSPLTVELLDSSTAFVSGDLAAAV